MSATSVLESTTATQYQDTLLYIDGHWTPSASGKPSPYIIPRLEKSSAP